MYCQFCGEKIPDDSVFCPFCGEKFATVRQKENASNKEIGLEPCANSTISPGFSDKINDPAIKAAVKKNKKSARRFGVVLILAPLIVTFILGVKNGDRSIVGIGAVISALFLIINLISAAKKKGEKQWDGTVIDKRIERRRKKNTPDHDRDAQTETVYIIQFRTENGKEKTLEEPAANHLYFNYLNPGDRVRYHPQFTCYYEKYDKSHDTYAICPICGSKNDIKQDSCLRCGVPIIK